MVGTSDLIKEIIQRSPGGSDGKQSALQSWRPGFDPWAGKIPWRKEWLPTPVFLPGKSHGQRSLAGCIPLGSQESNVTEQLTISHTFTEILAPSARRGHSEEMQQNPKEGLR